MVFLVVMEINLITTKKALNNIFFNQIEMLEKRFSYDIHGI